ncbi:MAG: hypothetical protein H7125_14705 [Proteobacteria bacterium]|nr:hypothetical protein [Burkholderiales bacterium]
MGAAQVAEAIVATWQDIDLALTSIVGPRGVVALYHRSVRVAERTHPWLAFAHEGGSTMVDVGALRSAFAGQDDAEAAAGAGAFLHTFHELLASLIGGPLTERLLRAVKATSLDDVPAQDFSKA